VTTPVGDANLLAYALNQVDGRWAWRVFDAEGLVVAGGVAPDQDQAQNAVALVFAAALPAPPRIAAAGL
jgi:predicted regulator of Ras-like GTPase activity (Roadblock/LC7/MglB family)